MADNYESLTVKLLKEEVANRDGLTIKSNLKKAEIIEKLREWDQEHGSEAKEDTEDAAPTEEPEAESAPEAANGEKDEAVEANDEEAAVEEQPPIPQEPTKESKPPPTIDTAPAKVSALPEPEKVPTPPPHHEAIEPREDDGPVPSKEIDNAVRDFAATSESTNAQDTKSLPPVNSQLVSADPSISPAELVEDNRKRKRRSLTPPVKAEEVEAKRAKMDNEADNDVSFTEAHTEADPKNEFKADSKAPEVHKDMRKLFSPAQKKNLPPQDYEDSCDQDIDVEPARHIATCGLYIGNLKRPFQEVALRRHLESLASSKDTTEGSVQALYTPQARTHALVLLNSIPAAARVRAAMHSQKWPDSNDPNRDPLFVDYVPDSKVCEWIEIEKNSGGARWHVDYTPDGSAVHTPGAPARTGGIPPKGPRTNSLSTMPPPREPGRLSYSDASALPPRGSLSASNAAPLTSTQKSSFSALSSRFEQTSTKPSLYFKRAPKEHAEKRLRDLEEQTGRDWREEDRKIEDEMYRYSWEFGTEFVSTGLSRGSARHARKEREVERAWRRGR